MAMTSARGQAIGVEHRSAAEERRRMAEQCFAHWQDLACHHPRGYGSLRIPPDYHSAVRPSYPVTQSLLGSPAASCAGF
jgi:hypothetical protein